MKTANPHGHAFPHTKLSNVQLTSIKRLRENAYRLSRYLVGNEDKRNQRRPRRRKRAPLQPDLFE